MKLLAISLALFATQAPAQQDDYCAPREAVVDRLASTYGETRQAIGLGDVGGMVEIYANDESGTFTIITTTEGGNSCIVLSGQAWERLNDALPPQGKKG